jgi:hypothetical protein
MPRVPGCIAFSLWLAVVPLCLAARPQDPEKKTEEPQADTFFAGTVVEYTPDKITISRVVLGKKEKRAFRVTPDTKCEGKVKAKVRVTVRYVATGDGETAQLIIVRNNKKKQP